MKNELIEKNFMFAKFMEKMILGKKLDDHLALFFAKFVASNPTGCYYFKDFEKYLIGISNQYNYTKEINKSDKILLVMSEAYVAGGHTRIVEHTIKNSPRDNFNLVFTRANFDIPVSLISICEEKTVTIQYLSSGDIISKSLELRKISSKYSKVVMHIHPEDFIPVLSYGVESWDIPVFLYNHAEHRTWFGNSIVDLVMDLSNKASENTKQFRMVQNSEVLDIPLEQKNIEPDINLKLREYHSIPNDAIVFFSGGSSYKYNPNKTIDFTTVVDDILKNVKNSFFVIIGIKSESKNWIKLKEKYKKRLIMLTSMPYTEYEKYYNIVDIYIDSMPVSGFTVLLEAAVRKIPIVALASPFSFPDSINSQCVEYQNIMQRVNHLISTGNSENNDMKNHYLENFIKKHFDLINSVSSHKSLDINDINNVYLDSDNTSYTSYILSTVCNNNVNFNHNLFADINFIKKIKILRKAVNVYGFKKTWKLFIPKKIKIYLKNQLFKNAYIKEKK